MVIHLVQGQSLYVPQTLALCQPIRKNSNVNASSIKDSSKVFFPKNHSPVPVFSSSQVSD